MKPVRLFPSRKGWFAITQDNGSGSRLFENDQEYDAVEKCQEAKDGIGRVAVWIVTIPTVERDCQQGYWYE